MKHYLFVTLHLSFFIFSLELAEAKTWKTYYPDTIKHNGECYFVSPHIFEVYSHQPTWLVQHRSKSYKDKIVKFPVDGKYIRITENDTTLWQVVNGFPEGEYLVKNGQDTLVFGHLSLGTKVGKWIYQNEHLIEERLYLQGNQQILTCSEAFYGQQGDSLIYFDIKYRDPQFIHATGLMGAVGFSLVQNEAGSWHFYNQDSSVHMIEEKHGGTGKLKGRQEHRLYINDVLYYKINYYNWSLIYYAYQSFHENGQPYLQFHQKNHHYAGLYSEWDSLGHLISNQKYKNGELVGGNTYQYDSLYHLLSKGQYTFDTRINLWTFYYPNGQLKAKGNYQLVSSGSLCEPAVSVPSGEWLFYNEEGEIVAQHFYRVHKRKQKATIVLKKSTQILPADQVGYIHDNHK